MFVITRARQDKIEGGMHQDERGRGKEDERGERRAGGVRGVERERK
jgi:hypothetical protein